MADTPTLVAPDPTVARITSIVGTPRLAGVDRRVFSQPPERLRVWSLVWRYALTIGWWLLAIGLLLVMASIGGAPLHFSRAMIVVDAVLGIIAIAVVRLRIRRPVLTALGLALIAIVSSSSGMACGWAMVHLATRRRWREILPMSLVYVLASMASTFTQLSLIGSLSPSVTSPTWYFYGQSLLFACLMQAVMVAVGHYVGARRDLIRTLLDRAEQAERNQELMVLQGQSAERNRIAREMHDVLAHRISLVSMHAGVLAYRTDLEAEQTRHIANTIQENAHQSLTELRSVLGSLREADPLDHEVAEGATARPIEKPQPTMVQINDLVADARAAGERIDYVNEVEHAELLPTLIGRHAYRMVQEALTNARKHAPHARVSLWVSGRPSEGLRISCRNPLTANCSAVPGSGVGLLGLRERAHVTGGQISHHSDQGMFELEVWLPW